MDAVLRGAAIYVFMMIVFRLAGRRTLSEMTSFDFVLLLIVAEAVQQALLGEDFSLTNAFLIVTTLIGIDIFLSLLKDRFPRLERAIEGLPVVILQDGELLKDRMKRARIDASDILEAARESQGLERLEQIKYAVLESSGSISIIPKGDA